MILEFEEAELQLDRLKGLWGIEGEELEEALISLGSLRASGLFRDNFLHRNCLLKGLWEIKWVFCEKVELKGVTFEQSNEAAASIANLLKEF